MGKVSNRLRMLSFRLGRGWWTAKLINIKKVFFHCHKMFVLTPCVDKEWLFWAGLELAQDKVTSFWTCRIPILPQNSNSIQLRSVR